MVTRQTCSKHKEKQDSGIKLCAFAAYASLREIKGLAYFHHMKQASYVLLFLVLTGCQRAIFKERWLKNPAPPTFIVGFETSKGYFEATITRKFSPLAVDRFYAQVKHGYYDHALFYRVRPKFVAQFGVDDSVKIKQWGATKVPDESVTEANDRGTLSFAREGKDSRGSDLFINTKKNTPYLDTIITGGVKGFPVIGTINSGMDVVDSLYSGYGDSVFEKYETLLHNRAVFLQSFPKLDSVKRIFLVKNKRQRN
jgi:peptidyl-prolyl cis-trans isomerase A (cyclophilin A)